MYKEVIRYETFDNKLFEDDKKALDHSLDSLRELLSIKLKPVLEKGIITNSDRYKIIMELIPDDDVEGIKNLVNNMIKIVFHNVT